MTVFQFNHGDEVRDRVTGTTGIVMSRTEWFNGCLRYGIQPMAIKDGRPVEPLAFDEAELEIVVAGKVRTFRDAAQTSAPAVSPPPGGPQNDELRLP